jgi:hypothetical protein
MNLERLARNHKAMDLAFSRLEEAMKDRDKDTGFISIAELLLWIITTEEWHKKYNQKVYSDQKRKDNCIDLMSGIRHAHNASKHDMEFVNFHESKGGFSFPMRFPVKFGPIKGVWSTTDVYNDGSLEKQLKSYKKTMEGKEILETLKQAMEFLSRQRVLREGG